MLTSETVSICSTENIWRTELDWMVAHRDRLVVLSFMPYQNTSDDQNDTRPYLMSNNDIFYEKNHLIEQFHAGGFDETDFFDTHEKLEMDVDAQTAAPMTTSMPKITQPVNGLSGESNRKQQERGKGNRQSGRGGSAGRKHSAKHKDADNEESGRKGKGNRRGDDFDEKLELKPNKKFDFGRIDEFEVSTVFETPKNGKKANPEDVVRKNPKDSSIHIVKPAEGSIVPSTPIAADSKIIEIKPTNARGASAKKVKRFTEDVDEFERHQREEYFKMASLIGAVPANISTTPVHLKGLAGCIQRYLKIEKEIGEFLLELIQVDDDDNIDLHFRREKLVTAA